MPGYISNVLSKFQHDAPKHPQHTSSRYATPIYGAKTQYIMKDETPPLTAQKCLTIQKVTGSALYYARAVDPTVLMPLNDIATEQTKATEKTQAATNQMLDYLATHSDATIRYHASDMILHIHSDASYLSVSNVQSRLGDPFFLATNPPNKIRLMDPSSISLPSSKACSPKVVHPSELHSLSWATHNPLRLSAPITPLHSVS
jgi:hypothetical protein